MIKVNKQLKQSESSLVTFQRDLQQRLRDVNDKTTEHDREVAKLNRRITRLTNDSATQTVERLEAEERVNSLKETRRTQKQTIDQLTEDNQRIKGQGDNLRLTLGERSTYIAEVEETIQRRDTEIALLRMEVETLTLWREKINQQYRTEADIEAAKSHVLQGRNVDQTLENLTRVDPKKNNR